MTRPPYVMIPQYFGSLVYNRTSSRYAPFDPETTELLMTSIRAPIEQSIHNHVSPDQIEAALQFAAVYREWGCFDRDGFFRGEVLPLSPPSDHLAGPLSIHLEVTGECTLRCRHCFANSNNKPSSKHSIESTAQPLARLAAESNDPKQLLSLDELDRLFTEFAAMGSFRLGLTGGEPFSRPEILDIIDLALDRGLQPCTTTNGLLITEKLARELGKRELIWLNVSLDGATAAVNDAIRGAGTFDAVIKRIRILSRHTPFSLAFTVMKHNIHEMASFCRLARSLGARAAVFRPLYPVGAAAHRRHLIPEFHEYIDAIEALEQTSFDFQTDLCSHHPWGPATRLDRQAVVYSNFGCGAGNTCCSISSNGDVSPCSFLGPDYVAGNLHEHSFQWIWNESSGLREMRSLEGDPFCDSCPDYDLCGGGCRARALSYRGSINAADPWCSRRNTISNNMNIPNNDCDVINASEESTPAAVSTIGGVQ